ncbi:hypothetical protein [Microscilla marina]|uniref:STAS/SEC14 domain-containing protein n=1 Tax=Microscilla marina ATCC 23134 TaxID=313606 RepID=A1ZCG4_MICM2|nr:hypothetical protein [Microscilla marina]EAY31966.1 hypothetical protein M23134_01995 [Microscilla marina ATCC 23134]
MEDTIVLYEDTHLKSTFFTTKKYILNYWTGSGFLTDELFKEGMTGVAKAALEHDAKGILVNTLKFDLPISPELQQWYNENIVPMHLAAGITRMAFLLTDDFYAQLSIEQTMAEQQAKAQVTQYFNDYAKAEQWLMAPDSGLL